MIVADQAETFLIRVDSVRPLFTSSPVFMPVLLAGRVV
jgi:hypothetical protein